MTCTEPRPAQGIGIPSLARPAMSRSAIGDERPPLTLRRAESMDQSSPPRNAAARWMGLPASSLRKATPPASPLPTAEQDRLAEAHVPLARSMARSMARDYPRWAEEFESRSMLELVEASRRFDGSLGPFADYARYRISGGLAASLRSALRRDRLDRLAVDREPPPPVGREIEDLDSLEARLRKIPKAQAEVCRLAYVEGLPQSEIAGILGRSASDVARLHSRSLRLLCAEGRAAC